MLTYALGPFRLDTRHNLLLREGAPVPLGRRAITLLRTLIERPGALVSKDTLIEAAWSGRLVDEGNLPVQIAALRRALGEAAGGDRWIETMSGRGYRFIGPIVAEMEQGAMAAPTQVDTAREPGPIPRADPELRQITAMSCELIGTPCEADGVGLEDLRNMVAAFQRCVSETVDRHGGFVFSRLGNAALGLFGYPAAHEYDAERAVRAALELCSAVRTLTPDAALPMRCRAGIATGMAIIGDLGGDGGFQEREVVGDAPNLAGRLQASIQPDIVAIEPATRRLIGNLFDCRKLGTIDRTRGTEPLQIWQVLEDNAIANRFEALRGLALSPLVGRDEEIAVLLRRWASAKAGDGQVVLVSGEPGLGKSRLAAALEERLCAEPHTRQRYQCSPHHRDSVLHPFVVELGRAARLAPQDSAEIQLDKLEAILAPARIAEAAPLFASLLSIPTGGRYPPLALSAAQQRRLTLAALLDQLEALARQKPVLLLFEDAHWADATSLEVLDLTVERVRALPILVLITFRPEYEPPWAGLSHITSIALDRLAAAEVETLAEHVAGRPLPPEVTAQIVTKTDGVPLFIEELTKAVLEGGLLVAGPRGWHLQGPLPPFAIPATLQDSLAARLDRSVPIKEIAQIGAAIGREFSYPLLRTVAGRDEPALRAALAQLEGAELLFRTGAPPDACYTFKHALVQDTAYETLLRGRRQMLHRQIADALRGQFPAVAAAEPELVAHHLTQAGLGEQATEWWGKAGDQALRRSAFKEAAAHLGKAIELADKLAATTPSTAPGSSRLRLQTSLGNALRWVKGSSASETRAAFARARELANREEDASERFSAYYGLFVGHLTRCEPAPLREMAELFLREATAQPNCPEALIAHRNFGTTCLYFGDFAGAHDHYQKSIGLYDQARHTDFANRFGQDPRASAEIYDALTLWVLGRTDEALLLADRALADAESAAHGPTIGFVHYFGTLLGLVRGNFEAVVTHSQAYAENVSRYGLSAHWAGFAAFFQSWAKRANTAEKLRLAEMRRGLAIFREQGMLYLVPSLEAVLAEAEASAGDTVVGLQRLHEAFAVLERTEQRFYEAEIHRIHAGILLKHDPADTAAAQQSLRVAMAIAQSQKARGFELRAALSLAKLYSAANRDADAHTVLAPAVEGFPPTQHFPELTEAQTLLAALRR